MVKKRHLYFCRTFKGYVTVIFPEMEIPYIIKNTIDAPDLREELGAQGPLREPEDDEDKEEHLVEEADNTASQIRCNLYGIAIVICLLWHGHRPPRKICLSYLLILQSLFTSLNLAYR